jgi:TRAP-type mannitol/chloroaromatic compound transport system permease large subunit
MLPLDQALAGLMFAGMIAFLFFGFPVAFSLIFTGLFFGMTGAALGVLQLNFFEILPLRIWGTMTNFTLLAVPLFVFMGVALGFLQYMAQLVLALLIPTTLGEIWSHQKTCEGLTRSISTYMISRSPRSTTIWLHIKIPKASA